MYTNSDTNTMKTDPNQLDTDGDGLSDYDEINSAIGKTEITNH